MRLVAMLCFLLRISLVGVQSECKVGVSGLQVVYEV